MIDTTKFQEASRKIAEFMDEIFRTEFPEGVPCVRCARKVVPMKMKSNAVSVLDPEQTIWKNGHVSSFTSGFGSDHGETTYIFGICDDCIGKMKEISKITDIQKFEKYFSK